MAAAAAADAGGVRAGRVPGTTTCGPHQLSLAFELKSVPAEGNEREREHSVLVITAVCSTTEEAEFEGRVLCDRDGTVTRADLQQLVILLREGRGFSVDAADNNCYRLRFQLGVTCVLRPKGSDTPVARLQAELAHLSAKHSRFAILAEDAASGVPAGATATGVWLQRKLNTVVYNAIPELKIQDGGVLLPRGNYRVRASVPGFYCDRFTSRMVSTRGNRMVGLGTSEYAHQSASHTASHSTILAVVSVDGTEVLRLEQIIAKCTTNCLGVETGTAGKTERYTTLEINEV